MCKKSRGALMQLSEHVCILIIIAVSEIKATQDNLWGSVIFQYFNRRITIWAPKQNGKTVLLKVQYFSFGIQSKICFICINRVY